MALLPAQRPRMNHVIHVPEWFIAVRLAQFTFAVVALALSIYGLVTVVYEGCQLTLIFSLLTIIVSGYTIYANYFNDRLYNYWIILLLELLLIVGWLCTWTFHAGQVVLTWDYIRGYKIQRAERIFMIAMTAAVALAALEWLLFIFSFVVLAIQTFRHIRRGGRSGMEHGLPLAESSIVYSSGELQETKAPNGYYMPSAVLEPAVQHIHRGQVAHPLPLATQ